MRQVNGGLPYFVIPLGKSQATQEWSETIANGSLQLEAF